MLSTENETKAEYVRLAQYELREELGSGQYGVVRQVRCQQTNKDYAMKIISKRRLMKRSGFLRIPPKRKSAGKSSSGPSAYSPLEKVYREIALLRKINHANLVKLVDVLDAPGDGMLYMVFELLPNGETLRIPSEEPLSEETARSYFRDTLEGLDYLHYQYIIHRDIKPANLLLDANNNVKISDLGVSVEVEDSYLISGQVGTPAFMSPELLNPDSGKLSGVYVDLWALGVTLFAFLSGTVPWNDITSIGILSKIMTQPLDFSSISPPISPECEQLISQMLSIDMDERPSTDSLFNNNWLLATGELSARCHEYVDVTDEDINSSVTTVPKLETLIMVKQMLKRHSFRNPFSLNRHSSNHQIRRNISDPEIDKTPPPKKFDSQ